MSVAYFHSSSLPFSDSLFLHGCRASCLARRGQRCWSELPPSHEWHNSSGTRLRPLQTSMCSSVLRDGLWDNVRPGSSMSVQLLILAPLCHSYETQVVMRWSRSPVDRAKPCKAFIWMVPVKHGFLFLVKYFQEGKFSCLSWTSRLPTFPSFNFLPY